MTMPTRAATIALTLLVDDTRKLIERADRIGHHKAKTALTEIATTLDGARTRAIEDGIDYLDAAWAFVDVGRRFVGAWSARLDRIEARHARA